MPRAQMWEGAVRRFELPPMAMYQSQQSCQAVFFTRNALALASTPRYITNVISSGQIK